MRRSRNSCGNKAARKGPPYIRRIEADVQRGSHIRRRAPLYGAPLCAILLLLVAACSSPRLQPADAQKMIVSHPRFQAPQTLRIPTRYCGARPGSTPPPLPPTALAYTPPQDVNHMHALQDARIITVAEQAGASGDCGADRTRVLFDVALTAVGANLHPTTLPDGAGWQFVLANRQFVSIENITYDNPDSPRIVHVQYVWKWIPTLVGQLVQIDTVAQGASATFLRDGSGWIVRQPGM